MHRCMNVPLMNDVALQAKNNGELLNNFGNFINRVLKFITDK